MQSLAMTPPLEVSVVSYYTTNIEIKTSGIRMVAMYHVCAAVRVRVTLYLALLPNKSICPGSGQVYWK